MCACVCMCIGASVLRSAAACPVSPTAGQTRDTLPRESGLACGWVLCLGFCMFCSNKKVSRYKEHSDTGFERLRAVEMPPNCSFRLVGDELKRLLSLLIRWKPVSPVHSGSQHQTNELAVWVLADSKTTVVSVTETRYPLLLSIWHLSIRRSVEEDLDPVRISCTVRVLTQQCH